MGSSVGPYLFTTSPSLFIRNCRGQGQNISTCIVAFEARKFRKITEDAFKKKGIVPTRLVNYLCEVPFDVTVEREEKLNSTQPLPLRLFDKPV